MKNNSQSVIKRKLAGAAGMLAFFLCFMGITAYAAENAEAVPSAAVVSTRMTDESVYVYIRGVEGITSGTTVQIGNTLCEDIQVANVVSMGMPIKTTILIDNSQSLSKIWGSRSKELAAGLIDDHAENEEFKIATFAESLNVLSDFTADYESLKTAVEGIEFLDQPSYLTDILYDFLRQGKDSGEANYTRLIIITDGADDNEIKYTQSELSDLMKESGVVIHTVGVKNSKNNERLETIFSYARLTGGTYTLAEKQTEAEGIRNTIDADHSLVCLRLNPQTDIMDGSRKEARFSLSTSNGTVVLTASLQMPFADVSSIKPESMGQSQTPVPESDNKEELPSIEVKPQMKEEEKETGKNAIVLIIVIGASAFALILIILLVVLLLLKGRKKKPVDVVIAGGIQPGGEIGTVRTQNVMGQGSVSGVSKHQLNSNAEAFPGTAAQRGGDTVRLGGQMNPNTAGQTLYLQGGMARNAVSQSFVVLTAINEPQRTFRVPIDTRIVIGRESGDIVLGHDAAVSRTHCEIIKRGNLFYVNDLKSSNGTFYGGMRVHQETPIMNGGILEVGTCKYKITIETL